MKSTGIVKRCDRCGLTSRVPPRQRRCYRRKFGKGSWSCWGKLSPQPRRVTRLTPVATPTADAYRDNDATYLARWRMLNDAPRKLAAARARVARLLVRIRRLRAAASITRAATSLRLWERRVKYYEKRDAMTDAAILAERDARASRPARKPRRGIRLRGDVCG